jgi:hypothetical protein
MRQQMRQAPGAWFQHCKQANLFAMAIALLFVKIYQFLKWKRNVLLVFICVYVYGAPPSPVKFTKVIQKDRNFVCFKTVGSWRVTTIPAGSIHALTQGWL